MDEVVDMIPSAVSVASVTLEPGYNQSGVAVAGVPARSPRPPRPAHAPEFALLARAAAAMTPHMADSHQ